MTKVVAKEAATVMRGGRRGWKRRKGLDVQHIVAHENKYPQMRLYLFFAMSASEEPIGASTRLRTVIRRGTIVQDQSA